MVIGPGGGATVSQFWHEENHCHSVIQLIHSSTCHTYSTYTIQSSSDAIRPRHVGGSLSGLLWNPATLVLADGQALVDSHGGGVRRWASSSGDRHMLFGATDSVLEKHL